MKGRIRIKSTESYSGYFAVRTVKACTDEDEAVILQKRENLKQKRRERRKKNTQAAREARAAAKESREISE